MKYSDWLKTRPAENKENAQPIDYETWRTRRDIENGNSRFFQEYASLIEDYNSNLTNVNAYFSDEWKSPQDKYALNQTYKTMQTRQKKLLQNLETYEDAYIRTYGKDAYKKMYDEVAYLDSVMRGNMRAIRDQSEYWAQWDNKEAYNQAKFTQKYEGKSYKEVEKERKDLENLYGQKVMHGSDAAKEKEELDWLAQYSYELLKNTGSYGELQSEIKTLESQKAAKEKGQTVWDRITQYFTDYIGDYGGTDEITARREINALDSQIKELKGLLFERKNAEIFMELNFDELEAVEIARILKKTGRSLDETEKLFSYAEKNGGKKYDYSTLKKEFAEKGYDLDELVTYYEKGYNAIVRDREREANKRFTEEVPVLPEIASILAIPGKLSGYVHTIGHAISQIGAEEPVPLDTNAPEYRAAHYQEDIREARMEQIDNPVGEFMYGVGMSAADFAALLPLAAVPGGQAAIVTILGGGAATDTAIDINERGGTTEQAFWGGLAAGTAEAYFDRFGLGTLMEAGKATGAKGFIRQLLKSAGVEGAEEAATEVANILSDELIMGDKSHYALRVKGYEESGMSREEAEKAAAVDMAKQVGLTYAGGFLMGGTLRGVKGGADIAGWTDAGASGTMETITTEQGGMQHGRGGAQENLGGDSDILWKPGQGTAEENAGRRETASEYVERIRANTTGAPAQAAGAGERGDVELRQVGNRLYAWETVPEGLQSPEAKETQRLLAEYGIPSEIVSWSQSNANGATSTMRGEASTLQDGTVLVKNHAELTARDMAGHEMAHVAKEQAPAAYQAYYDAVTDQLDFSSDAYLEMVDAITHHYFTNRGKTFDITTDYAALYEELVGYISGNMLADEAAARRRYAPMFHDFDAVAAAWRDMETAMRQTGRGTAEGSGEYGREKNLLGRYFRRKNAGDSKRSGISGQIPKNNRGSEKTASRVTEKMGGSRAEFDAVRERDLSPKQKAETAIARKYGYTLYHVPAGSEMVLDGEPRVMERTAFTRPGTAIIFARDGTGAQYIHHELFHQFIHGNTHGEMQLLEEMQRQIDYDSQSWIDYRALCESTYGENVPLDQVYEEITADLCEYAMSGSKTMRERLQGLFPDGALKPLTEQARQVFEANRQAAGGAGGGDSRRSGEDRRYLDGRDTPQERPAEDTRGAGGQPEPTGTGSEPGDSSDPSAPIEPAAAPADPVIRAAIDGVNGRPWDGESGLESGSKITGENIVFGSKTKPERKLYSQMQTRGWNEQLVRDTVNSPYTTRTSINKATGNPATVFYNKQGAYVIVDNVTKEIVQISSNINPSLWIPDEGIQDPYKPYEE